MSRVVAAPDGLPMDLAVAGVGAVVVGGDYQGLGIVRSLGRRGVPVHVIDDELSIARFSRYTTSSVRGDLSTPERMVGTLLEEAERLSLQGWVLFPTRDETVAGLSRAREELARVFRLSTPDWACVRVAWDKRLTYQTAERLGIPVPRTWYLSCLDDLDAIDGDPPFAVKPAVKEDFLRATRAKAWQADSHQELRRLVEQASRIIPVDQVMVQELVPGDGQQQLGYCALFKDGDALASMVVRRLRQHPLEFGRATTYAETVEEPLVEELAERLLTAIGYSGLVEVEFKQDPRDGRLKLLDVNARTWGYHSLGQSAGVDFPAMLFADQLGLVVEPRRARVGVSWVRLVTDLPTGVLGLRAGTLHWRSYLRSLRDATAESVFAQDDLLPGLAELALVPYLAARRGY